MTTPKTRAAMMAANLEKKLQELGQLPEQKPEQELARKEQPERVAARKKLLKKLRSFWVA